MADYNDLADALAANLASLTGVQESACMLSNPTPPAAEVQIGETNYHMAMQNGLESVMFTVRVFVGFTSDKGAFSRIREFMASTGSSSVKAAIEADKTLGGLAQDLMVRKCSGEKGFLREILGAAGRGSGQGPLLGAEWTVEVFI